MKDSDGGRKLLVIMLAELIVLLLLVTVYFNSGRNVMETDGISQAELQQPGDTIKDSLAGILKKVSFEDEVEKEKVAEVISGNSVKAIEKTEKEFASYIEAADYKAAMYDYDKAVEIIKSIPQYSDHKVLTELISGYEADAAECIAWSDNTKVSHVFFHSLIYDTSLAFGDGSKTIDGYNSYMTTVYEFERILEQMYEKGYVLVSIHDIAEVQVQPDGTEKLVKKDIMLPEGKIPFVMSQDDVNYYDYMDEDGGFATRIVVGEDGKPTCEYKLEDGTIVTGDYDLVPVLDAFVEKHPDFSYKGAKALLALTGYEGILGYETARGRYDEGSLAELSDEEAETMLKREREECKKVIAALKEAGYEFASHGYGHKHMGQITNDKLIYDTERWLEEVGSLLGEVDVLIYPYGEDICDWRGYSGEKYEYLKSKGFWYFCNVDSAQYWIQLESDYMRMGRFNLDGERMFKNPEKVAWFADVAVVLDPTRPYVIK